MLAFVGYPWYLQGIHKDTIWNAVVEGPFMPVFSKRSIPFWTVYLFQKNLSARGLRICEPMVESWSCLKLHADNPAPTLHHFFWV